MDSNETESITWNDLTPNDTSTVWTKDPFHSGEDKYLIRKKSEETGHRVRAPKKVIVVVDGSSSLSKWKPLLANFLDKKSDSAEVYVTGNNQSPLIYCSTVEEFEDIDFVGGVDNVPALRKALLLAKEDKEKETSILWVHGPQPIKFGSIVGLEQDLERSLSGVTVYNIALEDGANTVIEAMKTHSNFKGGGRVVKDGDLIQIVENISESIYESEYTWTRTNEMPVSGNSSWDQAARKWAYDHTLDNLKDPESAKFAASYKLVTPVSGAVVLESVEQYIETGLDIPDNQNMPSLPIAPEPSSILLLMLGAFGAMMRRKRCEVLLK